MCGARGERKRLTYRLSGGNTRVEDIDTGSGAGAVVVDVGRVSCGGASGDASQVPRRVELLDDGPAGEMRLRV